MRHSIRLKKTRNKNKLQFDYDLTYNTDDTVDCRLVYRARSDEFVEVLDSMEAAFDAKYGEGLDLDTDDDTELEAAFLDLLETLTQATKSIIEARQQ